MTVSMRAELGLTWVSLYGTPVANSAASPSSGSLSSIVIHAEISLLMWWKLLGFALSFLVHSLAVTEYIQDTSSILGKERTMD